MTVLARGPLRYMRIHELTGTGSRTLASTLRELTATGALVREAPSPRIVHHGLTPLGETLLAGPDPTTTKENA